MSEKIQVGVSGTAFTWNGEPKNSRDIVSVDGFKFVNNVVAWAQGRGGEHPTGNSDTTGNTRWLCQTTSALTAKVLPRP